MGQRSPHGADGNSAQAFGVRQFDFINAIRFPNASQWRQANDVVRSIVAKCIIRPLPEFNIVTRDRHTVTSYRSVVGAGTILRIGRLDTIDQLDREVVQDSVGQLDEGQGTITVGTVRIVVQWVQQNG